MTMDSHMEHDPMAVLLSNNSRWVGEVTSRDPAFFSRLVEQQKPAYMWIGCCDSRVPANEILGLLPGEVFVHRNIGNVVLSSDLNCMSAVQYAIEVLGIRHIILTGHYGCGAVIASMGVVNQRLVESWIMPIKRVQDKHPWLSEITGSRQRDALCELNVIAQVGNLGESDVLKQAWKDGCDVEIHGLIYDIADGCLREMPIRINRQTDLSAAIASAEYAVRTQTGRLIVTEPPPES